MRSELSARLDPGKDVRVLLEVGDLIVVQSGLHDQRRQRISGVLPKLREHVGHGNPRHHRERSQLPPFRGPALRQVRRPKLDPRAGHVHDEGAPVSVDDRPARRFETERANTVVVGLGQVTVARQDLQRPEAHEQRGEDGKGEEPEHCDPERELRRQPVRLFDARIAGQEAAAGDVGASQAAAPR